MQIGTQTNFAQHSKYTWKEKRREKKNNNKTKTKKKQFTIEYNNKNNKIKSRLRNRYFGNQISLHLEITTWWKWWSFWGVHSDQA